RPLDPRIVNVLRCLPAANRETLLLIAWGELTADDAASALGVPPAVAHDRLDAVHARVVAGSRADGDHDDRPAAPRLGDLLGVLGDNADLGLDPVRQPRIESALSRRFAAPPHWSLQPGAAQFLGG